MQDITKEKCDNITSGTEGRLIDKRDNKVYWVAKLEDGLCWMTQNLDYDGGATDEYSGSDVVILEEVADTIGFTASNAYQKLYYDPGKYVYTLGAETHNCGEQSLNVGISACIDTSWRNEKGWRNVTGMMPSPDPNYYNAIDAIGEYTYLYNAHYLIGNYYNWIGATNDTTIENGNADSSVCPTGWSLPMSNSTDTGSFGGLLNELTKGTDITIAPYYFVYGGYINSTSLEDLGELGFYGSSTTYSSSNAFFLHFTSSNIVPSNYNGRQLGFSVRCVAR